ncbi:MAG: threonine synthase, partial [Acidobacteria bacterium]|nr:threonine synthase [Acidobacteriota bacterium]
SGNFGNLTAGLLAERMGLEVAAFVAATNANDVVPQYLESGLFSARPSVATLSNAMDVGNPSNFARIRHLFGGDLAAMRSRIRGFRASDEETRQTIREVFERTGYVLDPHTAVGYRALSATPSAAGSASGIVLATAHPVKFREHVEPLIGRKIPIPHRLAECLERPRRSLPLPPEEAALKTFLEGW